MQPSSDRCHSSRKDGFGRPEKILMRSGFYGFVLVGAWAIGRQDLTWATVYMAGAVIGLLLVVYLFLCRYCPYPFHYGDCLFFPHQWLAAVVRPPRGRMGWHHQLGFTLVMILLVGFPQPWLLAEPKIMPVFWLLAGPTVAALPIYYCRRCRHRQCVFNF